MTTTRDATPPRTEIEKAVCEIWSEILGRTVNDVAATWTSLGGDSVGAIRVASRLRARLGVRLNLATVLRSRTVVALAEAVGDARPASVAEAEEEPPLRAWPDRAALPMSFFQEWRFVADLGATEPLYNLSLGFELRGSLNASALQAAVTEMVCRHEPLRSNFAIVDSAPIQVIHPRSTTGLSLIDVRKVPEDQQRAEGLRQLEIAAGHPLDRQLEALFQPFLVRMSGDRHLLMMLTDRIAVDGSSLRLIIEELSMLYACAVAGVEPTVPGPAVQQADWASWQRDRLRGPRLDRLIGYWRRKLDAGSPLIELSLPPRLAAPARTRDGRFAQVKLGQALSREIRRRVADLDVTLYMYGLAALQLVTARLSGRSDATVVSPFANRTRQEVERSIGCFSHGVIYRTDVAGDPSFAELVGRVRDVCLDAWDHQELPIGEVARHVRPQSYLRLFDEFHVFFDVTQEQAALNLPGVQAQPMPVGPNAAHPSLAVFLHEGTGELVLTLRGEADRFQESALDWLARQLASMLSVATAEPATRLSLLPPRPQDIDQLFG
jgi:acyl carrier protein